MSFSPTLLFDTSIDLDAEDIAEFKEMWRAEFDEEISDADAQKHARNMIRLAEIVIEPFREQLPKSSPPPPNA